MSSLDPVLAMGQQSTSLPCWFTWSIVGVCPSSLHALCGLFSLWRRPPITSLRGTLQQYGLPGSLLWAIRSWPPAGLPLVSNPVCAIQGQDLKAQPSWRECPGWDPKNCISAFHTWHGSLGSLNINRIPRRVAGGDGCLEYLVLACSQLHPTLTEDFGWMDGWILMNTFVMINET